jgi:hypothetical protein
MPPLAGHDIRLYLGEVADAMEPTSRHTLIWSAGRFNLAWA